MSNLKFYYIDDEDGSPEQSTRDSLIEFGLNVEIFDFEELTDFGSIKDKILILSKDENFGGLIIDLRLDGSGKNRTHFNATALAQEIRSMAGRGDIALFPMILTSTEEKLSETYYNDKTSHDLFDYKMVKYSKDNIKKRWEKRAKKINSLAKGYKSLSSILIQPHIHQIYEDNVVDEDAINNVAVEIFGEKVLRMPDTRFISKIYELLNQKDTHLIVDFIIKEMFHFTNPLMNQRILFSKLGLNYAEQSESNIDKIKSLFDDSKYKGIYSEGWERWWIYDVENKLNTLFETNFSFLTATKRVEKLESILETTLEVSKPIKHCVSNSFDTICEATKRPIDSLEAYRVGTSHNYQPWQIFKVMSLEAILERIDRDKVKPHPLEKERINYDIETKGLV